MSDTIKPEIDILKFQRDWLERETEYIFAELRWRAMVERVCYIGIILLLSAFIVMIMSRGVL